MEDGYTVYDDDDDNNNYDNWYMYCVSLLTPIAIMAIIYVILN